jgi:hypothetical protein
MRQARRLWLRPRQGNSAQQGLAEILNFRILSVSFSFEFPDFICLF